MAILSPTLKQRFFTAAGLPLVGGKLYTYVAGTTTPLVSYTSANESVANSNPIILDADGECDLWLGSNAYKMVLTDSSDVVQWTTDNVNQASQNTKISPDVLENFGISATVSTNVLTVSLTNASGSTPSVLSPVSVGFRSASLTSGISSLLSVSSSLGMTVSSGSTLGHASGVQDFIFIYLINNNGTAELAVSSTLYSETALYSTVAEGGSGAADSGSTIYSIAARTNVPIRLIGRLTVTQATAGAWSSAPSQIQAGASAQLASNPKTVSVQRLTSGSGTYTTPNGVKYLVVEMVGGGGGGSGAGFGSIGSGANGASSTFGSSLLTAGAGSGCLGASLGTNSGGAGGTSTINSPAITIVNSTGSAGGTGGLMQAANSGAPSGSCGGASAFGGAGSMSFGGGGTSAASNSGSGGGGGGITTTVVANTYTGGGGGAGGYLKALIQSPAATYAWNCGAGGSGGAAGSNGGAGGAGGSGLIVVYEYYI